MPRVFPDKIIRDVILVSYETYSDTIAINLEHVVSVLLSIMYCYVHTISSYAYVFVRRIIVNKNAKNSLFLKSEYF